MAVEKRIVVGASGASGMPLLMKCLEILRGNRRFLRKTAKHARFCPVKKQLCPCQPTQGLL